MPSLQETFDLAHQLHEGVQDCTGEPYIRHPIRVMSMLPPHATRDDGHLAVLHDTLEDCKPRLIVLIAEELQTEVAFNDPGAFLEFYRHRGYSPYVVEGLRLVSRDFWFHLSYIEWIKAIVASGHPGAIRVKYADNCDHSDPDRISRVLSDQRDRVVGLQRRYNRSKAILKAALDAL